MITTILIIICFTQFCISYFVLKNTLLSTIISWWFFWLITASLYITGLYELTGYTFFIVVVFLSSITLGAVYVKTIPIGKEYIYSYEINDKSIYLILSVIFAMAASYLVFKFINVIGSGDLTLYRSVVLSEDSPLYENKYVQMLFAIFLRPVFLFSLFIGIATFILNGGLKFAFLGSLFLIVTSIVEFGRFGFYIVAVMFLYSWLMGVNFKKRYFYALVFLGAILVILLTKVRSGEDEDLLYLITEIFILNYHTISFSILNHDLVNLSSSLYDSSYGFSSILSILDPLVILLRVGGVDIVPQSGIMAKSLDELRLIGMDGYGNPILANAFGSILYGLYRDGGVVLIGFFGFCFGFVCQKLGGKKEKSFLDLSILAAMFYLGIMGIFMPLIQFPWLISILLVIIFNRFFIKKYLVE